MECVFLDPHHHFQTVSLPPLSELQLLSSPVILLYHLITYCSRPPQHPCWQFTLYPGLIIPCRLNSHNHFSVPLWPNLDDLSFSISIFGLLPKSLNYPSCLCTICSLRNSQSSLCLSGHVSLLVATLCWVSPHLDYSPHSWLWPVKPYFLSISSSPFWLTHCALAIRTSLLVLERPRSSLLRTFACVSFTGTVFLDLYCTGILLMLYVLAAIPSPQMGFSGHSSSNIYSSPIDIWPHYSTLFPVLLELF